MSEVSSIRVLRGARPIPRPLEPIAGYAFHVVTPKPSHVRGPAFGPEPTTTRSRWGYRTYDCIPAAVGRFANTDLLIAGGLNGRPDVTVVGALQACLPDLNEALSHLDPDSVGEGGSPPFWELERDQIADPEPDTHGWWLSRAWWVLMRQRSIGPAITHKTLHHKRPRLWPLLDNPTLKRFDEMAWPAIHDQLTRQRDEWSRLEDDFESLTKTHGGVALTRLRLYDILLWLDTAGELADARRKGRKVLAGLDVKPM